MMYKLSVEITRIKDKRLYIGLCNYLLNKGRFWIATMPERKKEKGRMIMKIIFFEASILFYSVNNLNL